MSAPTQGSQNGPPARDPGTQTIKAVVVLVVAIVIAVVVLHHAKSSGAAAAGHSTPAAAAAKKTTTTTGVTGATTTTTVPLVSPSQIQLQVLNGVGTGAYAGDFSTKLHTSPGYNTLAPDNATAKVQSSAIYIVTAGYLPEAEALAQAVGLPTSAIVQTTPPPSSAPIPPAELSKANLVLVVGPDLVSKA